VKQTVASALDVPVPPQPRTRPSSRDRATPHQLLVLGIDIADVVTRAGGLICDSVRAGLDVKVCLEAIGDEQALRILGVRSNGSWRILIMTGMSVVTFSPGQP